jgi:hypothetical protein
MDSNRKNAIIVGVLILLAYSMLGSGNPDAKILGMFLEAISGAAVIGISIIMFPLFKPYNVTLSRGYLILRIIEGSVMIITGLLFLSNNTQLLAIRDALWAGHVYVFIVGALVFNYLLYISEIIPKWLSGWGIIASILLLIVNLLELANIIPLMMILRLPIITNEVVEALWFIVKGFNQSAITSESAKPDTGSGVF